MSHNSYIQFILPQLIREQGHQVTILFLIIQLPSTYCFRTVIICDQPNSISDISWNFANKVSNLFCRASCETWNKSNINCEPCIFHVGESGQDSRVSSITCGILSPGSKSISISVNALHQAQRWNISTHEYSDITRSQAQKSDKYENFEPHCVQNKQDMIEQFKSQIRQIHYIWDDWRFSFKVGYNR